MEGRKTDVLPLSEFLSLVRRFLSWNRPGMNVRNVSVESEHGKTFVTYEMNGNGHLGKRVMAFGSDLDDCASISISYMCLATKTSGKEELELFLSSEGF